MAETKSDDYTHRVVGGRSYHNQKSVYPMPNDDEEHERLDDLQLACRLFLGGNILVPIPSNPTNILDAGTGSGAWCVEVANQFPNTNVYGLDLSPIRRKDAPNNCHFMIGNVNDGLKFDDNSMDLVHSRQTLTIRVGIAKEQWPIYMREVYRILKPGTGWVQCGEMNPRVRCDDGTCPEDATIRKHNKLALNKIKEMNVYENTEFLEKVIKDAGFVDVKVKYTKLYYGTWVKDHSLHEGGRAFTRAIVGAVEPLIKSLIGPAHFADEHSLNKFIEDAKADLTNPDYHIYGDICVVIGRKPEVEEGQ